MKKIKNSKISFDWLSAFYKKLKSNSDFIAISQVVLFIIAITFFTLFLKNLYSKNQISLKNKEKENKFQRVFFSNWDIRAETIQGNLELKLGTDKDKSKVTVIRGNTGVEFSTRIDELNHNYDKQKASFSNDSLKIDYQLLDNGIKEEIIINEKPNTNRFTSEFKIKNLKAFYKDNLIVFEDKNESYQFHITEPYAYDAAGNVTHNVKYELKEIDAEKILTEAFGMQDVSVNILSNKKIIVEDSKHKNYQLITKVDLDWLNSEDRVYPITIDPTIIHDTSSEFTSGIFQKSKDIGSGFSPSIESYYQGVTADSHTIGLWPLDSYDSNPITTTGGTISYDGNYVIHSFTSSGTFTTDGTIDVEYLIVGGGGGGGNSAGSSAAGGGGGAGGFLTGTTSIGANSYSITVGSGGTAGAVSTDSTGGNGGNSSFNSITAIGGGGGGARYTNGLAGGSGGGAGSKGPIVGGAGTSGQGYAGGDTTADASASNPAAGGGGASAVGATVGADGAGGNGGNGLSSSITGTATYYAGGGGGGDGNAGGGGTGGLGGGGNGGSGAGTSGTANTGGGGGGAGYAGVAAGSGGSGIVILRYLDQDLTTPDTSPNENTAIISGDVSNVAGIINNSQYLDGNDSLIITTSDANFTKEDFTIEMWIKPEDLSNTPVLFSRGTYNSDGYYVHLVSNGSITFRTNQAGTHQDTTTAAGVISTGIWQHIAFVRKGNSVYIYVDGEDVTSTHGYHDDLISSNNNFVLGTYEDGPTSWYYTGYIDELRISNVARSQEEIKASAQRSSYSVYTSPTIDLNLQPSEATLSWSAITSTTPAHTNLYMEYRTSTDSVSWSDWSSLSTESLIESLTSPGNTWGYRRPITITNTSGALSNYQVLLSLDTKTLIDAGKMNSNCSDIRFTSSDGTTLISHWVESDCYDTSTLIWIKVPSIPASSTATIYLNYGKESAESVSSIENTFIEGSFFHGTGACNAAYCASTMDNHTDADTIRSSVSITSTSTPTTIDESGGTDYFIRRYRFLFKPKETGLYGFGVNSDDGSEIALFPGDGYGGGYNTAHPYGQHDILAYWYSGHGTSTCMQSGTPNAIPLVGGEGYWLDYVMSEGSGGQYAQACLQETGSGSANILSVANYPGQIFRRQYTSGSEPSVSLSGTEAASSYSESLSSVFSKNDESLLQQETSSYIEMGDNSALMINNKVDVDPNTALLMHFDETNGDLAGTDVNDESTNNIDGEFSGTNIATNVTNGISGKTREFNGSDDSIDLGNPTALQITGDQTIEMWLYPYNFSARRNPYNKSYGGEGTITQELNGTLNYFYGTAGSNAQPYQGVNSVQSLNLNSWNHVALVRDLSNGIITWYINGEKTSEVAASYTAATASSISASIGSGYASNYSGLIDEVRISNVARTPDEIENFYKLGNQSVINKEISATDLSSNDMLPFYIAADRPGTYLETIIGENSDLNSFADENTVGYWKMENDDYFRAKDSSSYNNHGATTYLLKDSILRTRFSGIVGHPTDHATMLTDFTPSSLLYYGITNIVNYNTIGDNYDNMFSTFLYVENEGTWSFAVDGDDAVEVEVDGTVIASYYGGHGACGCQTYNGTVSLTKGWHQVIARHEEDDGGDSIVLYYKDPDDAAWNIFSTSNLAGSATAYAYYLPIPRIRSSVFVSDGMDQPYKTTISEGVIGKARTFNGINEFIEVSDSSSLDVSSAFTFEAWVNPTSTAGERIIFCKENSYEWAIKSGTLQIAINNSSPGWAWIDTGVTVDANTWTHLVISYDGSNLRTFKNGTLSDTTAATGNLATNSYPLRIASRAISGSGTSAFAGQLDEVKISNVRRSDDEIKQSYERSNRAHQITIDFAASLDESNLITNSGDTSFTIDATTYGLANKASKIYAGEKIIIKENTSSVSYMAQGTVSSVNESTGAITVSAWDTGSTFPTSGYSKNADVFKWQREYWPIENNILDAYKDNITNISLRFTNGNEGRTVFIDDFKSSGNYLTSGGTLTDAVGKQYLQYRGIFTTTDTNYSAQLNSVTLDYQVAAGQVSFASNSYPNYIKLNDTTPTVLFSAVDLNDGDLQYEIQYSTDSSFTTYTSKDSESDSGFTNTENSGDTAPFASGEIISYDWQNTLSNNTTYFYRARARIGSIYGDWSEIRSLTTDTSLPNNANQWYQDKSYQFSGNTNTNITTTGDNISISSGSGSSLSSVISASDFHSVADYWQKLSFNDTETNGDITYQIFYNDLSTPIIIPNSILPGNEDGFDTSPIDLTGLTVSSYPDLYIKANLTYDGGAPSLDNWGISLNKTSEIPTQTTHSDETTLYPTLNLYSTDIDNDYLQFKITLCTNSDMTANCQTFDQTSSQTGWSGQDANSNTAYNSGSNASYTIQTALQENTTYYWKSISYDPDGSKHWSDSQTNPSIFTTNTFPGNPDTLLVEGESNPQEVKDITPEFSAIYRDNDPEDTAVAYQIQVSTDSNFNVVNMWDSGKTSMSGISPDTRMSDVSYAGNDIAFNGATYYWRIRFWDDLDFVSPWSSSEDYFTMYTLMAPYNCLLVRDPQTNDITITWADDNPLKDSFTIQKSTNFGTFTNLITGLSGTTTEYLDENVLTSNIYQYRITTFSEGVQSPWCTTDILSIGLGNIYFEGLNMSGLNIN